MVFGVSITPATSSVTGVSERTWWEGKVSLHVLAFAATAVSLAAARAALSAPPTSRRLWVERLFFREYVLVFDLRRRVRRFVLIRLLIVTTHIEFKSKNEAQSKAEWDKRSTVFHIGGEYLGDKIPITQKKSTEFNQINDREYKLEFGDHGNYESILNYVRGCKPRLVITDNYRSSWGESLAERINDELQDELQITAISQP